MHIGIDGMNETKERRGEVRGGGFAEGGEFGCVHLYVFCVLCVAKS